MNKCKTELQYWRSKAPMPSEALRKCENCGHITLAPLPVEDNEDHGGLVHQGVKMDPPASASMTDDFIGAGPSGVSIGSAIAVEDQDGACCHSSTRALAESSESEGEPEAADSVATPALSSPTVGGNKKGGKKAVQQRPLLGKRKRKSVDSQNLALQNGNQPSGSQQTPVYAPNPLPPPSPKNLRCKAGKQPAVSNVPAGASGGNKRLKLI